MAPNRVLVGFAESLAAIEVAASLRDADYDVRLFSREGALTALSHGQFSQGLERIIAPEDDIDASQIELKVMWDELGRPPILPLDDISLWLVNRLAQDVPELTIIGARGPLADLALDKAKQISIARQAGFDVLETCVGDGLTSAEFPRYAKGQLAAETRGGRIIRTGGRRVSSIDDLRNFITAAGSSPVISQRCVEGVGEGIFGIARNGRLLVASGHRRVRMMNPVGSGSSACESRVVRKDEIARTQRFLEMIRWDGLFMLEFLRDSAGTSWFMELNGRPWGSMALARAQGFDYPRWAADQTLRGDEALLPLELASSGELECRHLGRELIHIAHLLFRNQKGHSRLPLLFSSVRGMLLPMRSVQYYNLRSAGWEIFLWDTLFSLARHDINSRLGRLICAPGKVVQRLQRLRLDAGHNSIRQGIQDRVVSARKVAVVCYGNINRSAVAEAALSSVLPQVDVRSYGLHRRSGRAADPVMVEVVREFGLDLSRHRSRIFTSATANEADLILVMERWHLVRLQSRYPRARGKIFLMSSLGGGTADIPDPFLKDRRFYSRVAKLILDLANRAGRIFEQIDNRGASPT